ncbi:hypothetical protein R1flu_000021 [Riccia fluitans]|uniref:Uncharacterized protein n=1 Tax=Riccia fluitans TaxID=41844 RepID=A0ABD1XZM5_9MARC
MRWIPFSGRTIAKVARPMDDPYHAGDVSPRTQHRSRADLDGRVRTSSERRPMSAKTWAATETRFIGHCDRDTKARPATATTIINPGTHPAKNGIAASRQVDRRGDRANASGATFREVR